jgi:hypothetical protein
VDVEETDDTYMNDIAAGIGACASNFTTSTTNNVRKNIKQLGADVNSRAIEFVSTGKVDIDYKGALEKICPGDF